jgi:ubiquinone biosynthesis protein Coq4
MGLVFNLRNNLGSLYAAFRLGRRPDQVKYVFMMGDRQDNLAEVARTAGQFRDPFACAEFEAMRASKYQPAPYDIAALAKLPEHTLGGTYGKFMLAGELRPDYYEEVPPRHKMHYLRLRLHQTHDIWHLLTGFDTDQFGEVGLQGFYFGQVTNGQSALIFASAILKSLFRCRFDELERFIVFFCDGYNAGRQAHNLLPVKWEEHWRESIVALRERYGIRQPACVSTGNPPAAQLA